MKCLRQTLAVSCLTAAIASPAFAYDVYVYRVDSVRARDLGTLGGNRSYARDINDSGVIVGWADNADGTARAFRYSSGVMTDIGIGTAEVESQANGLNDVGAVVGH